MKRKLVIISNDALVYDDIEYLRTKPLFKQLLRDGSWIKTMKTVYPSITYCCHASMITGAYPAKTGVTNNNVDGWRQSDWMWERKYIKVKTLIDAAKENGYTTANVFWPVLGQDENIDYNIPEYWSQTSDEPLTVALKRMGTSDKVIKEIVEPNLYYIDGHQRQHPYCDEFMMACARDMILKYRPDLLVVHPAGIDGKRHEYGVFNEYVTEQLDYTYYWIEKIIRALKETGDYENTDIVITSDHGQIDIKRWGCLNVLLAQAGLIETDEQGNVTKMRAYANSIAASGQIKIVDENDKEAYDLTYKILKEGAESKLYGFESVFTKEEIYEKEKLAGNFDFVVETDGYSAFDGWSVKPPYFINANPSDYRLGNGTHGHLPDKGPQPTTIMIGPDFKKGVTVERCESIDMAVTLAKIFGWSLPDADGKVIEEIINK